MTFDARDLPTHTEDEPEWMASLLARVASAWESLMFASPEARPVHEERIADAVAEWNAYDKLARRET